MERVDLVLRGVRVSILLSTFTALNIFIGVVVSALDAETAANVPSSRMHPASRSAFSQELLALRAEVAALRRLVHRPDQDFAN
jgi:voltage-gated sodium channel